MKPGVAPMTSTERVLTTLAGGPTDRVPLFLPLTMHGAWEVGLPLDEYFTSAAAVAEGQLRLRAKYPDDIVYPFFYGALELEAFGGEVQFYPDGPPNAVGPLLASPAGITDLQAPRVADSPPLTRVLDTLTILRDRLAGEALIVGVVMSPYSMPVMQLGFAEYLQLLYEQPDLAAQLHAVNEAFAVEWANAQLAAGANAIGYFDPLASPTVLPTAMFTATGLPMMTRSMAAINGPCAALLASGITTPVIDDLIASSAVILGASSDEDLGAVKRLAAGRATVMGNLNGIAMRRWSPQEAAAAVNAALAAGAPGGRFIVSDTHGEIPMQVPADVLHAIVQTVADYRPQPPDD